MCDRASDAHTGLRLLPDIPQHSTQVGEATQRMQAKETERRPRITSGLRHCPKPNTILRLSSPARGPSGKTCVLDVPSQDHGAFGGLSL